MAKSASFREKTRKIVDLAKTCNFSKKAPCFGVLTNFSAKSCKECLISRKNTKNRRFGQNLQLFEESTVFRRFDELFGQKSQKVPHFAKKGEKSSIWQKLATFSKKPPCFGVLTNFSAKSGKKCLISWKKEKNRRFGQKLQVYRRNHRVSAF